MFIKKNSASWSNEYSEIKSETTDYLCDILYKAATNDEVERRRYYAWLTKLVLKKIFCFDDESTRYHLEALLDNLVERKSIFRRVFGINMYAAKIAWIVR